MIEHDRIMTNQASSNEEVLDRAIRPLSLNEYMGQEAVCQQLSIFIQAARARNEPL